MCFEHHIPGSVLDWSGAGFECNDLFLPSAGNRVIQLIPIASHVGIDLPCNSWTKARRAPLWSSYPHKLRGPGDQISGLQGLSKSDLFKTLFGDTMLFGSVKVIRKCLKFDIPGYLENPKNSWLWGTPQMKALRKCNSVHLIDADQCQYGTQGGRSPPASCSGDSLTLIHCRNVRPKTFVVAAHINGM